VIWEVEISTSVALERFTIHSDTCHLPQKMSPKHLETVASAVIGQTMRRLPDSIRSAAGECLVEVAWMESSALNEEGLSDDLLGLFEGCTHGEDHHAASLGDLPRIRLFLDNLWGYAGRDRVQFREEVRITLLHELGHYLGLNEQQVEALGLA
jgi:predicted Zn-dependent protease with MMP-like domain